MRKTLFVISFLLVLSLLIVGCAKDDSTNLPVDSTPADKVSDNPDTYVDEQIVDENETVEIGELI